jgi:hypothetical protein
MRMIAGGLIVLAASVLWAAGAIVYVSSKSDPSGAVPSVFAMVGFVLGFIGLSMALYGDRPRE